MKNLGVQIEDLESKATDVKLRFGIEMKYLGKTIPSLFDPFDTDYVFSMTPPDYPIGR